MDRFFAENRLSALIDGTLSSKESKAVKRTIGKNADLATQHAAMLQAIELMRTVGPAQAPTGFQVRLMTQVEALPKPGGQVARVRSAARRVPMEAVALVALALVIGIVISQRGSEPEAPIVADPVSTTVHPQPEAAEAAAPPQPLPEPEPEAVIPEAPSTKPPPAKTTAAPFEGDIPAKTPAVGSENFKPSAYNILGLGDQVLFKVDSISQMYGGRMVTANGQALAPSELTEAVSFKRVFIVVPITKSTLLHNSLKKMSGKMPVPVTTKFNWLRPDQTIIMIEAQL